MCIISFLNKKFKNNNFIKIPKKNTLAIMAESQKTKFVSQELEFYFKFCFVVLSELLEKSITCFVTFDCTPLNL